jgi:hypothetical protein
LLKKYENKDNNDVCTVQIRPPNLLPHIHYPKKLIDHFSYMTPASRYSSSSPSPSTSFSSSSPSASSSSAFPPFTYHFSKYHLVKNVIAVLV